MGSTGTLLLLARVDPAGPVQEAFQAFIQIDVGRIFQLQFRLSDIRRAAVRLIGRIAVRVFDDVVGYFTL